jgi:hypothetical protein
MKKKTAWDIVSDAYSELQKLQPSEEEIQEFSDLKEKEGTSYGVVTYSKHKRGQDFFLHLHDSYRKKIGGRVHIDVGYVDEKYVDQWNIPDTTHLMLDKHEAPKFVEFVKNKRKTTRNELR